MSKDVWLADRRGGQGRGRGRKDGTECNKQHVGAVLFTADVCGGGGGEMWQQWRAADKQRDNDNHSTEPQQGVTGAELKSADDWQLPSRITEIFKKTTSQNTLKRVNNTSIIWRKYNFVDFSFRLRPYVSTKVMLRTYQAFETHYVHQTILSSNLYKHYLEALKVKQEKVLEGTKNKHRR